MTVREFTINDLPALLIGEKQERVFLFVHGLGGNKEEALSFAEVACPQGFQVLSMDLPVERKPWEVVALLIPVREYLFKHWQSISLRSNSIGSWFSMLAFGQSSIKQALFVAPILDMKRFLELMDQREEDYYQWVVEHPVCDWNVPTFILRPKTDLVVADSVGCDFVAQHSCRVTIMENGEHWFHTPEQLDVMRHWEQNSIMR